MQSIGDMARALVLRSNQARLRTEMDGLAVEVATGTTRDPARHLGGDVTGLLSIDRSLARLETFRVSTAEAQLRAGTMQTALDGMQTRAETLAQTLLQADLTPSRDLLDTLSDSAADALTRVVGNLNASVAGRFLFSGVATDQAPVPPIDDVMSALRTAATGETTAAGVMSAIEAFFSPGGGFETTLYAGSDTPVDGLTLNATDVADLDILATDPAIQEVLKPMAMAALAGDPALSLDTTEQGALLSASARVLQGAVKPLVDLRASLGATEARIEDAGVANASERTALSLARQDLVGLDDYETATRYEHIRGQLESLYAITARSQRLSLAEYL